MAQSPGEFAWRMELLATLERQRIQNEVGIRAVLQELARVKKAQWEPEKLVKMIKAQVAEGLKPDESDFKTSVLWKAGIWFLEKGATIGIGVVCTLIGLKALK
jgi:hypothetical protein